MLTYLFWVVYISTLRVVLIYMIFDIEKDISVSIATVAWLSVLKPLWVHPDRLMKVLDQLWTKTQLLPLRWLRIDNVKKSWLLHNSTSIEWAFDWPIWKILFWSTASSSNFVRDVIVSKPTIIAIDFDMNSPIEIADWNIPLYQNDGTVKEFSRPNIFEENHNSKKSSNKQNIVIDNFHLRDFTPIWRKQVMSWVLPTYEDIEHIYTTIDLFQNPEKSIYDITALHIQERNIVSILHFLSKNNEDSLLLYEIEQLRDIYRKVWWNIPVVLELMPHIRLQAAMRWHRHIVQKMIENIKQIFTS